MELFSDWPPAVQFRKNEYFKTKNNFLYQVCDGVFEPPLVDLDGITSKVTFHCENVEKLLLLCGKL